MKILKLLIGLVLLLVLLGGAGLYFGDGIAKSLIEDSGSQTLGVATRVNGVSLGVLSGEFGIDGLSIANPAGFEAKDLLTVGGAGLDVAGRELLGDPLTVGRFEIRDVVLNLEQGASGSNFGTVIEHVKKQLGTGGDPAPDGGEGKRVRVKEVVIKNVTVNAKFLGAANLSGTIPDLRLENLGTGDNEALQIGELATGILQALIAATLQADLGLPKGLTDALGQGLGDLQGLGVAGLGSLEQGAKAALQKAGVQATKALEQGVQKLGEEGQKALEEAKKKLPGGLGGLLGGDKK